MTRRNRRGLCAFVALVAMVLGGASSAFAAWSSLAQGAGGATAGTMPSGPAARAVLSVEGVVVSWDSVELQGGAPADYAVSRYAGDAAQTPATGCNTVMAEVQCTERAVPEGRWTYAVATAKGDWRGTTGTHSEQIHIQTSAPTALAQAGTATRTTVNLSWTNTSQVQTGFKVERSADGASWTTLDDTLGAGATSFQDTTLGCDQTHQYRVTALSTSNGASEASTVASATTAACPQAQPAPSSLTATGLASSITLLWVDNASEETGYRVEVAASATGPWGQLGQDLPADTVTAEHTGLACGTTRHYRVKALGEVDSAYSNAASATTAACVGPLAAPSALSAAGVSPTQIDLTWTDNSSNETSFLIERSNNGNANTFSQIGSVGANVTTFSDATLTCGTARFYRVRATNTFGQSSYTDIASATTIVCPPTTAPTLTVTAGATALNLSWTSVTAADSYAVERLTSTNQWDLITTVTAAQTLAYSDAVGCGQSRQYRLRAANAGGDGPNSSTQSGTTFACPPSTAPTLNTITFTGYNANLSWSTVTDATGYKVERLTDGSWQSVTTTTGTSASVFVPCTQTHSFRVRGTNGGGEGPASNDRNATSGACPRATGITLTNSGTAGTLSTGDKVAVTFDAVIDVSTFCSAWSGTGDKALTANGDVTVTVTDKTSNDELTVSAGSCTFAFGTAALGGNYVSATSTFSGNAGNASQIHWTASSRTLTITLGGTTSRNLNSGVATGTATYTPASGLKDSLGNPVSTTAVSASNQRL